MSKIKTCIVCGKKYEYCGHCDKGGQENRWKTNYCSENCRDIFNVISRYVNNHISKEDARNELIDKDLNINAKDGIAKYFEEIMICKQPEIEEPIEEISNETEDEITPQIEIESKSKRRRRHIKE